MYSMSRISQRTMDQIEELDLADFAEMLGDPLKKEGRHFFTYRNGGEKTPSLCITPDMRMWTAFGSTESGRNAISYYGYRKWNNPYPSGKDFIEAVKDVAQIAGILIEYEDGRKWEPTGYTGIPKIKQAPPMIPENTKKDNPTLDRYFRRLMNEFPIISAHKTHLTSEKRKMNDHQIQVRQYRSLTDNKQARYYAASKISKEFGEPEGIPGFMFVKGTSTGNYWTIGGKPGLLIPFRDISNHISGFQIRYDKPQIEIAVKGIENVKVHGSEQIKVVDGDTGSIMWDGREEQLPIVLPDGVEIISKRRWYGWLASKSDPVKGILKGTSSGDPAPYHCAVPTSILEKWRPGQSVQDVMDTSTIWWGEGPLKGAKRFPTTAN